MSKRLCIVPRWGGDQRSEWYPWLRDQEPGFDAVLGPELDDPGAPTIDAWVDRIAAACGDDPAALADTYFLGHSVGCQAIVRYLAGLQGPRVAGCLLVAAWWTVDEPWDTIRPWMYPAPEAPPLDLDRVRAACDRFVVLISDNDPFTADWQATRAAWQERVGADVRLIPGAKHFNATEAPEVLSALAELAELTA